jgi:hypothetical protein
MAESLSVAMQATYVWDYESNQEGLRSLYDRAKQDGWDPKTDLDWSTAVDPEGENFVDVHLPVYSPELWRSLGPAGVRRLRHEWSSWLVSQFLHGEQGALLATSQLVASVPWLDAKLYGASQVLDEARHVEVYERYLREKLGTVYPVDASLKSVFDTILSDARFDMKYLGMQVLVEGLALAAFRYVQWMSQEPLLKEIAVRVIRDEARHIAFGVLALRDLYCNQLSSAELRERQDFVYDACVLLRERFLARPVWERLGLPVQECLERTDRSPSMGTFRRLLYSKIIPSIDKLGLMTPVLRERFVALQA